MAQTVLRPLAPCHPLNYYVQNVASYFTSNTVVEFLPRLHERNYTGIVLISHARNLTLIGSDSYVNTSTRCSHSDSVVFCTNYSGFLFERINGLNIIRLHFTHCGAALYSDRTAINFLSISIHILCSGDSLHTESCHLQGHNREELWIWTLSVQCLEQFSDN